MNWISNVKLRCLKQFNCVQFVIRLKIMLPSNYWFKSHTYLKYICILYSHEQLYIHICMQNHNDDTIKTSGHSSLEKYTSHFIWKGSKGLRQVLLWEGVGDWTELQHIDPHSYDHNSVSFPFSWAAQPGGGGQPLWDMVLIPASSLKLQLLNRGSWSPPLLGAGSLYSILSPTDWLSVFTRVI